MNQSREIKIALGVLASLLLIAPFSIDLGPIPLTLQTFCIFIGASLLSWRSAAIVVLIYLASGALGLPVFGHHTAGFEKLHGATSGFLWGFVLCAIFVSIESARKEFHFYRAIIVLVQAHLLLLIPGFLVLYYQLPGADLWATLMKLLPGLIIKSIIGGIIASQIRRLLYR